MGQRIFSILHRGNRLKTSKSNIDRCVEKARMDRWVSQWNQLVDQYEMPREYGERWIWFAKEPCLRLHSEWTTLDLVLFPNRHGHVAGMARAFASHSATLPWNILEKVYTSFEYSAARTQDFWIRLCSFLSNSWAWQCFVQQRQAHSRTYGYYRAARAIRFATKGPNWDFFLENGGKKHRPPTHSITKRPSLPGYPSLRRHCDDNNWGGVDDWATLFEMVYFLGLPCKFACIPERHVTVLRDFLAALPVFRKGWAKGPWGFAGLSKHRPNAPSFKTPEYIPDEPNARSTRSWSYADDHYFEYQPGNVPQIVSLKYFQGGMGLPEVGKGVLVLMSFLTLLSDGVNV